MKTSFFFLIFSITCCTLAFGQTAEEYYKKASDLYDKQDYTNCIANIDKALGFYPGNSKYLLLKGNAYEKSEKYQEAFDVYTQSINANSRDGLAYNQRGLLLTKVRQTDEAILDFTTALGFETNDTMRLSLYLNRGVAKINSRNFQGAYDDLMESLKIDSLSIGTLNNLASVCDEVGKGDQTLKYLYKIIAIDSTFIGAYGNIGFKYQEMGDYRMAIKFFNKVLEMDADEPLGFSNRAFNLYKLGEYKAALSDVNKSIKLYPANSYAFRIRALIYLALKEKEKACADLDQALRLGFTKMFGDEAERLKIENCR